MSFTSWLRNVRSALAPSRMDRNHRRRSLRAAAHRPNLELLEDRCTPSTYAVTDLGTLGGNESLAYAVNASGVVAGSAETADGVLHAFRWQDGVMTDLGTLGGIVSHGYGINDAGQVVGPALPPGSGNYHAFLSSSGNMTDLGTLGAWDSVAHDINKSGQVVGWWGNYPDLVRAFIWQNGLMTELAPLPDYPNSAAYAINDSGQAAGVSAEVFGPGHASLWQDGVVQDLGTLPGYPDSVGRGINASGQVVGWSSDAYAGNHAFLWQNGTMQDLGTLAGSGDSAAIAINASAQVVGSSGNRAFVWQNGMMTDLNGQLLVGSGWELGTAWSINDGGQIVGDGIVNGATHAFLLTPSSSLDSFIISGPSTATAGDTVNFTVTVRSDSATTLTDYTGTVTFSSSDWQAGLPVDYTFTTADQGVHTFTATLRTAGSQTLSVADTAYTGVTGSQSGITVNPAAVTHLGVGAPATGIAGTPFNVILTALDPYNNTATGYTGTIHFTSSDPKAAPLADYTFTAADKGVHTFSNGVTLKTAGGQTVTATDTVTSSIAGSAAVTVSPAAASTLIFAGFPAPVTAGVAGSFTVTARDLYGNVAAGYTGTVRFTSSDGKAALPGNYTFTAADAGLHTFSATLKTAGTQSLTVTDISNASLTGAQAGITVNAAAASRFIIKAPSSVRSGVAFSLTVTVQDAYGNVVTGYTGTIHFTSTDSRGTLPANYTFTAADKGIHTFSRIILRTRGNQTIRVLDTLDASISGSLTQAVV